MVDVKYANAYSEILEILNYVSLEDYNKIPKNEIDFYKSNANKNHIFIYNPSKTLEEQKVSKITKALIILLFRDYWATEKQKEKIILKQACDVKKWKESQYHQQLENKYNPDDLFKDRKKNTNTTENIALIEYKKTSFQKILEKLKNLFRVRK